MLFKRVNRSDPEQIFIIGYNSSSDAWSNGYVVMWDYATDADGVGLEKPAAHGAGGVGWMAIAGVVAESIAAGAYGMVQIYGYHSAVRMRPATGASIAAGTALICATASAYCFESVKLTGTRANAYPKGFSFEAYTMFNTTAAKKAFIMCL